MRWRRALPVLALLAWLPLVVPVGWRVHGAYPDLSLLLVLFVALRRGREDAALAGVALGLVRSPFTAGALGLDAFVMGGTGFVVGHLRKQLHGERWHVQAVLVVASALTVRLFPLLLGTADGAVGRALVPACLSAIATLLAAPRASPCSVHCVSSVATRSRRSPMYERRLRWLTGVFVAVLCLIGARAFAVQVVAPDAHIERFRGRQLRSFPILPRRGEILFADGSRMAWNVPGFALEVAFGEFDDRVLPTSQGLAASFDQRRSLDREEERERLERCVTKAERDAVARQLVAARAARAERRHALAAEADALAATVTKKGQGVLWECATCGRRVKDRARPEVACRQCGTAGQFALLPPLDLGELADVLQTDIATVEAALVQALRRRKAAPTHRLHALMLRIPSESAETIAAFPRRFPGLEVRARRAREVHPSARTIAGATRLPTRNDLVRLTDKRRAHDGLHVYSTTEVYQSLIGATFLERRWDERLRGVPGRGERKLAESGRFAAEFALHQDVQDGAALHSSVVPRLQKTAVEILERAPEDGHGAAVLLDVRTGGILAIASTRNDGYDHARSHVVPGSVFKLVTALAFLRAGGDPLESCYCTGVSRTPRGRRTHCETAHGQAALHEAFQRSCNLYFSTMAERLGPEPMAEACRILGMERNHDIGLETWEQVQSRRSTVGIAGLAYCGPDQPKGPRGWEGADMYYVGIGQGKASCSPLQVALAYARLARNGRMLRPWIVEPMRPTGELSVDPDLAAAAPVLREAARLVVTDGTARNVGSLGDVRAAGKSGTAEVDRFVKGEDGSRLRIRRNNTWFVGYAPYDDPRYVAVVVFERMPSGAHGASTVGEYVAQLLREAGSVE